MIDGVLRILGFPVQLWLNVFVAICRSRSYLQSLFVCLFFCLFAQFYVFFVQFVSLLVCAAVAFLLIVGHDNH